jgi:hypothetical protein
MGKKVHHSLTLGMLKVSHQHWPLYVVFALEDNCAEFPLQYQACHSLLESDNMYSIPEGVFYGRDKPKHNVCGEFDDSTAFLKCS